VRVASIHPRLPDWTERLAELWTVCGNAPFEWGAQDCVSFAANAAIALTGLDPLREYRGKYHDEDGAYKLVGEAGLQAFVAGLMAEFGATECPLAFAQRGDWAMVLVANNLVTGVISGDTVVAPGARRLAHVPLARAVVAWAI
jgi:hypothetical protein